MGTTCTVATTTDPADARRARRALAAGRAEVEACERALSRFDPDSDLSRLNDAAGEWVEVDERLVEALRPLSGAREVTRTAGSTRRSFPPSSPPATTARSSCSRRGRPGRRGLAGSGRIELDRRGGRARVERRRGRRPRRDRQGLLGHAHAVGDARRVAGAARCARRPRRRHGPLGLGRRTAVPGGSRSPTRACPGSTLGDARARATAASPPRAATRAGSAPSARSTT